MAAKKKAKRPAHRPPERFKSDLEWKDGVKKALGKKKPKGGWPNASK